MSIVEDKKCTGCTACVSVCPKKCISMLNNEDGFFMPYIDAVECINCGMCRKVCPNNNLLYENSILDYYACWCKDNVKRKSGSSGGVFGIIAENVINRCGVVFGAVFSDDCKKVYHTSSNNISLSEMMKSKYVESELNTVINDIERELIAGKNVLFCGTPCQVMGVRAVLGKKYDKLILVDFVCHGVPSHKIYQKYLSSLENRYKKKIKKVGFRSKKYGWKTYCISVLFDDGSEYLKLGIEDPYLKMFFDNKFLRKTCYGCDRLKYSEADITLGDFWNVNRKHISDTDDGISLVLINNKKGKMIFEEVINELKTFRLQYEDINYIYEHKTENLSLGDGDMDNYRFEFDDISFVQKFKVLLLKNSISRNIVYKLIK